MSLPLYKEKSTPKRANSIRNVLAIGAGKGGVGKSAVTVNLALALRQMNFSVGILDADVYGPSMRKMLPEETLPRQDGEMLIPAQCFSGISMISMAYFRKTSEAIAVRSPIANGIISQFLEQVLWGTLDYLLIDFPPGTGDIQLTLAQKGKLSGAVIVTTPQEVALIDVRKAIDLFKQVQVPILGIIENMSYYRPFPNSEKLTPFGSGGGVRLAKETGVELLGQIPLDPELCRTADEGLPLIHSNNLESETVQQFLKAAKKLSLMPLDKKSEEALSIQSISQENEALHILFSDGLSKNYRWSELQKSCPCAGCVDEATGLRRLTALHVNANVKANHIEQVGRYALKIHFSSGCSSGIYSFQHLHAM